ncbi:competence protein ComFC [Hypnocyclicus thermotrophus]|uniref:Competence protein ComFC n=2 Tax=Hypnocyclicus thermotrophus TaxID=1627895 RepID=A0AA46DXX4_9FUSO|nr:competence protein ComFC [Hypnocyclicus thermotrophus]
MQKLLMIINNLHQNFYNKIFRGFFYDRCILCQKSTDNNMYICYNCFKQLKSIAKLRSIKNIYYIWDYETIFSKLLKNYKLNRIKNLENIIVKLIKHDFFEILNKKNIEIIIPVPINNNRIRERGFNQTEEILKKLNIKYLKAKRIKATKKMSRILNKKEREKNIKNAFKIEGDLENKIILIFDDVITTGTTVNELIKTINKKYMIKEVYIFTLSLTKTAKKILNDGRD